MVIKDVSMFGNVHGGWRWRSGNEPEIEETVRQILVDVSERGDEALLELGRKFDSPHLDSLKVSEEELESASVPDEWMQAITETALRVREFHERQLAALTAGLTVADGVRQWSAVNGRPVLPAGFSPGALGQRLLPVASVGIYVPGGRAPYASSAIMNAVPAQVAGVPRVVLTSPPSADGSLAPAVLAACRHLGIRDVFKVGGAGAIAALALGTNSMPQVDLVAGPGNRYVNEAKRQLWGFVGLDGFAGPSEVCIVADDDANAEWAAADLLTQIEHAPDNIPYLIAFSRAKVDEILAAVERQLKGAKREATMREAFDKNGVGVIVGSLQQAAGFVNLWAPEHVTVALRDPEAFLPLIRNAGCVLLGEWTPESAGDYVLGPSHTLPTGGGARFGSPLNVLTFMKLQSVVHTTQEQIEPLAPTIQAFGEMEGFPAHARGATIRFSGGNDPN